jgi:hypothetical protein
MPDDPAPSKEASPVYLPRYIVIPGALALSAFLGAGGQGFLSEWASGEKARSMELSLRNVENALDGLREKVGEMKSAVDADKLNSRAEEIVRRMVKPEALR